MKSLEGKKVLITGAARRVGRELALAAVHTGAAVIIHHGQSVPAAASLVSEIEALGGQAQAIQADFSNPQTAVQTLTPLFQEDGGIYALVNNAAIFEPVNFFETTLQDWDTHLRINLTLPFLLSQAFAVARAGQPGRIINILDWRALRPGIDHFPYTVTKSALAAMTQSLARSLAPTIQVNGLALGAILPPSDGNTSNAVLNNVPAGRWATMEELRDAFSFLLAAPDYITGEIMHLDGGRHLV